MYIICIKKSAHLDAKHVLMNLDPPANMLSFNTRQFQEMMDPRFLASSARVFSSIWCLWL